MKGVLLKVLGVVLLLPFVAFMVSAVGVFLIAVAMVLGKTTWAELWGIAWTAGLAALFGVPALLLFGLATDWGFMLLRFTPGTYEWDQEMRRRGL